MSVKLTDVMERALVSALNAAAKTVAASLLSDGIPTVDSLSDLIATAMRDQADALSEKLAAFMSIEALGKLTSKKANLGTFMGMIKGACVVGGMKARDVFDLTNALKAVAPIAEFAMSAEDCQKAVGLVLTSLGTKVSSAIASYVAQAGIAKGKVLEVFSEHEENLIKSVSGSVYDVVEKVISALKQLQE